MQILHELRKDFWDKESSSCGDTSKWSVPNALKLTVFTVLKTGECREIELRRRLRAYLRVKLPDSSLLMEVDRKASDDGQTKVFEHLSNSHFLTLK